MTPRNLILIIILALFFGWYAFNWAYKTQYRAPREKLTGQIDELSQQIERGESGLVFMKQFNEQTERTYWLYPRSLPPVPNDAQRYSFLLLEMLQYCGLENTEVQDNPPTRVHSGADYRFYLQCTGTLSQLSHFLFEFYYAPFLHRITTLTLTPIDGDEEKLTFAMTINALAMNWQYSPYPATNQLPSGWVFPRLASDNLATYQVIGDRHLLRVAKGGRDRADFTRLTEIRQTRDHHTSDQTEIGFTVLSEEEGSPARDVLKRLGDTIHFDSFVGKIVEIHGPDIVLERNGERWLLTTGERLNQAFALPPETAP